MKRFAFFALMFVMMLPALAQRPGRQNRGHNATIEQFNERKCTYIVRQLNLNAADSTRFVPLYQELLKQKSEMLKQYAADREVLRALHQHQQVADTTLMRVNRNIAAFKVAEAQLDQDFIGRLEKVLSPAQIYNYVQAEQQFKNQMMERGRRSGGAGHRPNGAPQNGHKDGRQPR